MNSGVRRVGILTQYKSHSLHGHIHKGWGYLRGELGEFIEVLPAQQRVEDDWYSGTANAVYQNLQIVEVPVTFYKREGSSRLFGSVWHYAKRGGATLIRTYLYHKPLRFFLYLGLMLFISGFILAARVLIHYATNARVDPYLPTAVLSTLCLIFGFQIITLGFERVVVFVLYLPPRATGFHYGNHRLASDEMIGDKGKTLSDVAGLIDYHQLTPVHPQRIPTVTKRHIIHEPIPLVETFFAGPALLDNLDDINTYFRGFDPFI